MKIACSTYGGVEMKFSLESSFLTWNSIPVPTDGTGENVAFVYAGEGQAKLDFEDGRSVRFHLQTVGGEKFNGGPDYLDFRNGDYFDCYTHVLLKDEDGDTIIMKSEKIDNQEFIMGIAGGTGKWNGIGGQYDAKLTFVEVRKTEGENPATHYWCVYAFEGEGNVTFG